MSPLAHRKPSISVSGPFYVRLRAQAKRQGVSIASLVEQAISRSLGEQTGAMRRSRRYRGPR